MRIPQAVCSRTDRALVKLELDGFSAPLKINNAIERLIRSIFFFFREIFAPKWKKKKKM